MRPNNFIEIDMQINKFYRVFYIFYLCTPTTGKSLTNPGILPLLRQKTPSEGPEYRLRSQPVGQPQKLSYCRESKLKLMQRKPTKMRFSEDQESRPSSPLKWQLSEDPVSKKRYKSNPRQDNS